ncbi:glutamate racemase [Motilimonas sp. KMU-193]|uniref:glutamate racemase n=1 Tax=Motilimonas sp. KMU-193 TaxID=3388668 RepID=UPI00396AF465
MRILIFDSGVGGLSVYQEIAKQLPQVSVTYLFDNALFPYGELTDDVLVSRVCHLMQHALEKWSVDLVVIACNTASTLVLEPLRQLLPVPVVGVVPAIKPAAKLTQTGCIGLLATPGTVSRSYTDNLIRDFAPNVQVLRIGSSELVKLAEQKLRRQPVAQQLIDEILSPWLNAEPKPDCVVLGCTHFPLLHEEITHALGSKVTLVDSGAAIAQRVDNLLEAEITEQKTLMIYCTKMNQEVSELNDTLSEMGFSSLQAF